jgi:hypothetical protein
MARDARLLRQDSEPLYLLRTNIQRSVRGRVDQSPPASYRQMTPPTRKKSSVISEAFTQILPAKFASLSSVLSSPKMSLGGSSSFRLHRQAQTSSYTGATSAASSASSSPKMSKTAKLSQSQPQISSLTSAGGSPKGVGGGSSIRHFQLPLSLVTEGSSYCISQDADAVSSVDTTAATTGIGTGSDVRALTDSRPVYMAEPEETNF